MSTINDFVFPTTDANNRDALLTDGNGNLFFGGPDKLALDIRNEEAINLLPGDPVYSLGEVGSTGVLRVAKARADDPTKMPAIGVVTDTINPNSHGEAIINGVLNQNITSTGVSPRATLYVAPAGGLTVTKPSHANVIQNIGHVLRSNASGTVIQGAKISSIDRTNDVPNLSAGHIFYEENGYTTQTPFVSVFKEHVGEQVDTIDQRVTALYSYVIGNTDSNLVVTDPDLNTFISTTYPVISGGLSLGDTVTLSATDTVYILCNTLGSAADDWFEVTLKPNTLIYKSNMSDGAVIDAIPLNRFKSAKYSIEVSDNDDVYFTELTMVSNGTISSVTTYGTNFTSTSPFVEFGSDVVGNTCQLSISAINNYTGLSSAVLKANRTNLF